MEKLQLHPELASGISTSPPAGIMLIQHPGRLTEVSLRGPVPNWYMVGLSAR